MKDEITLNLWTIPALIVISQGLFLALVLLLKREKPRQANILLAVLLILFSLCLYDSFAIWSKLHYQWPHLFLIYAPCYFLIGPVTYFYFKTILQKYRFKKTDLIYLLPPLCIVVWRWNIYGLDTEAKREFLVEKVFASYYSFNYPGISNGDITMGLAAVSLFTFAYLIWKMDWKKAIDDPLCRIFIFFLGFAVAELTYLIIYNTSYYNFYWDYIVVSGMAIFIYGVGYMGYQQEGTEGDSVVEVREGTATEQPPSPQPKEKYIRSSLTDTASQSIAKRLTDYMAQKKPYLNTDLRLPQLAESLDISTHHLSQVINKELNKSFTEFVNEYRVEEAKDLLSDPKKDHFLIIDVGYSAGFNNKTSFYKIFKENTGYSPSMYRKKKSPVKNARQKA